MLGSTIGSGAAACTAERFGAMRSVATATRLRAVFIDTPCAWVTTAVCLIDVRSLQKVADAAGSGQNRDGWIILSTDSSGAAPPRAESRATQSETRLRPRTVRHRRP